jgi:chitinase
VNLVNGWGFDGADIDYEYPAGAASTDYGYFISDLDSALGSKLLTAAVAAFGTNADGVPSSAFSHFDFINLMAYDIREPNHSTYQDAVDSLNYWTGRGLPASKAVLGLPMYSHPNWTTYATLFGQNSANACRDTDGTNYWNGIPTIRSKSTLAAGYGGVMTWELSQDVNGPASLLTAMYEAVNGQSGSYSCSGGGGGTTCGVTAHGSAGPCGWYSYNDCCSSTDICAAKAGCVP